MERSATLALGLLRRVVNGTESSWGVLVRKPALHFEASWWQKGLPQSAHQTAGTEPPHAKPLELFSSVHSAAFSCHRLLPFLQSPSVSGQPLLSLCQHDTASRAFSQSSKAPETPSESVSQPINTQVVVSEGTVAASLEASHIEAASSDVSSGSPYASPSADVSADVIRASEREEVSPSFVRELRSQEEPAGRVQKGSASEVDAGDISIAESAVEDLSPLPQIAAPSDLPANSVPVPKHSPPTHITEQQLATELSNPESSPLTLPPEATTPPSEVESSPAAPSASKLADDGSSQIVENVTPAEISSTSVSETKHAASSPATKNKSASSKADSDPLADQEVRPATGGSKSGRSREKVKVKGDNDHRQSSGGAAGGSLQWQTRPALFPKAARHTLAPVEYLTAKYGNLEITHPKEFVSAPDLDSRQEGFVFTGFEVVFFGTSSNVPSLWRNTSCTAVRVDKSTFLVDCGDGSLQQLLRTSPFRLGSIEHIFITHMHGDHVHGLAALVIFLAQRPRGAQSQGETRPEFKPIHVYGPLGLRHFLRVLLSATHSSVEIGYAVHELLPPSEREQRSRRIDDFLMPHPDELPGADIPCDADGTWHVYEDKNVIVKAGDIKHSIPCFGYVIAEKLKRGKFDREKADALGIDYDDFGDLQAGKSRTLPNGRTVHPDEVTGPPRRGRKIVVLGDTYDASSLNRAGWDCDLLVHEATVLQGERERDASRMGHSTASMAGQAARAMEARTLVLTHISPKHQQQVIPGMRAARQAFGSERVLVAEDYTRIQVEYAEANADQRHMDALLRPQDRKLPSDEQWRKVTRKRVLQGPWRKGKNAPEGGPGKKG